MADAKTDPRQSTLDLIVLRLLRGGPGSRWDITQSIQVVSKGAPEVNSGSVYPALRRLVARGFVKARWGMSDNNRRARFYELTASGRKQLAAQREAWERFERVRPDPRRRLTFIAICYPGQIRSASFRCAVIRFIAPVRQQQSDHGGHRGHRGPLFALGGRCHEPGFGE